MWQNNLPNNGRPFQNNYNQDSFSSSPVPMFGGGGTGPPHPNQQVFEHHQSNMVQFEDVNGEGYSSNAIQPEVPLYNQDAFMQNRFMSPNLQYSPTQYNMPQPANPTPTRPPAQISSRAAELKAQLLKGKEARGGSATPPVPNAGSGPRHNVPADAPSSLRGSPQTPIAATENHEQDVNDLISQYSDSKPTAKASVKQETQNNESITSTLQQASTNLEPSAKSQDPSLGSPTKVSKPITNSMSAVHAIVKANESRHASNGSMSEGEIFEDTPKKPATPTQPRDRQPTSKPITTVDELSRTLSHRPPKPPYTRGLRDESPPRRAPPSNPKGHSQRAYDDRREEPQPGADRRSYQPEHNPERKHSAEFEKERTQRRSSRDENHHRADSNSVQRREDTIKPVKSHRSISLAEVLPHDEDLRDWLEITGFHNAPYRDKILGRRRALAKIDAERKKLLADIEADERGGLPITVTPQLPTSSMLPPPIPNKSGSKPESSLSPTRANEELKRDGTMPNKRAYSDVDDGRDEGFSRKIARTDDRNYRPRAKEERIKEEDEEYDHRRPRSSGFGTSRRSSFDHRDERDAPRHRYDDDRNTRGGRGSSRDRDVSPGRRAYENRPPPRTGNFGPDDANYRDEYQERDKRQFLSIGGYKGKAYDPNYRGRGRGRGRGDFQSHVQSEMSKIESTFGNKLASGRPYRDARGFDRGGKGDTRYFIVKSFNEENVMKCIADSVWTTQVQNGEIFKEAFETCKNVILVFSINKSRAFQGYARMESLPGTVEVPEWQRTINWESAGAFKVKWLVICSTRFHRIGHLKNAYNENQAVLIGKDGQEIEENCGAGLIELIDEEAREAISSYRHSDEKSPWEDYR